MSRLRIREKRGEGCRTAGWGEGGLFTLLTVTLAGLFPKAAVSHRLFLKYVCP